MLTGKLYAKVPYVARQGIAVLTWLSALRRDERGMSNLAAVGLILGLVVLVALTALTDLGTNITAKITEVVDALK